MNTTGVKTSGAAVASLVLGLLSLLCCGFALAGIPAIICGAVAIGGINRANGLVSGRNMAITGIVTGSLGVALSFLALAALLLAGVRQQKVETTLRSATSSLECEANLARLAAAKDRYAEEHLGKEAATPADLVPDILAELPECPSGGIYSMGGPNEPPSCSLHGPAKIAMPPTPVETPVEASP
jgi:hypothetical protein